MYERSLVEYPGTRVVWRVYTDLSYLKYASVQSYEFTREVVSARSTYRSRASVQSYAITREVVS